MNKDVVTLLEQLTEKTKKQTNLSPEEAEEALRELHDFLPNTAEIEDLEAYIREKRPHDVTQMFQLLRVAEKSINENPAEFLTRLNNSLQSIPDLPNELHDFLREVQRLLQSEDAENDLSKLEEALAQQVGPYAPEEPIIDTEAIERDVQIDLSLSLSHIKIQPFHLGDPSKNSD